MVPRSLRPLLRRGGFGVSIAAAAALLVPVLSATAVKPACAETYNGTCGDRETAIFNGSNKERSKEVTVKNTGACILRIVARKVGESQPEVIELGEGKGATRTGKFAVFVVRCSTGSSPCQASVTGF